MGNTPTPSSWINLPQRLGLAEEGLREALWQFSCDLRVAIPGIIQSFDAAKQTVTVQLAIRENIKVITPDGQGGAAPVPTPTAIYPIVDVAVVMPRAGGYSLTLPVQAGDECLVIFTDMCYNAWWYNGGVQNQEDRRRHDLSDGIAILGPWSQPRKLTGYSTTAAQLRSDDGSTLVEVGANEVKITATNVTVNGNLAVNGNLSATGTLDGKNFLTHTHSGVTTGGGVTGPPV